MGISEVDLEEKRRYADSLRTEIRSIAADTSGLHGAAELELTNVQLDAEIARLEREKNQALEHQVGTVEAAVKLMERAASAVDPVGARVAQGDSAEPVNEAGESAVVTPTETALSGANTAQDVEAAKAAERSANADLAARQKEAAEAAPKPGPAANKTGGNK